MLKKLSKSSVMKKLCKNKGFLGTIILASTLLLNGCASGINVNSNESSEKTVLTMWHYYNGSTKDMLDSIIKEFNETIGVEKNIMIDAYSHSGVSDLASSVIASAKKEVGVNEMPDIFAAYADTALVLDELGVLSDIGAYFTDAELDLFRSDFLSEGRFDGEQTLKIFPVAKSTEILFINKTDFEVFSEATGVNMNQLSTWESMADVAEIYYDWTDAKTEEEYDGKALFGIDSEANFILTLSKQLSNEFYDYSGENIEFGLTEDSAKKIWECYLVPYIKGHYVSYGSFRSDDVKSGDLLAYVGSTSSVYYFPSDVELGRTDSYDIKGVTMPFPYFEDGEKVVVQQGAGMLVTKSDSVRENAAAEFLKWFTSPEYNLEFAVSTGYIPVRNDALSYYSVIEFMEDGTSQDVSDIVLSSVDVTYNSMISEYEFYSNKPFDGSYDARNVIREHLQSFLASSCLELDDRVASGENRNDVMNELTGDDKFIEWYFDFKDAINSVLG